MDLINETCFLIWNISLPFLKKEFRKNFQKAFTTAADLLEQIESNESQLRANLHFELTKCYLDDDLLAEADTQITKALNLDYSIPVNKLGITLKNGDRNINVSYLQRNLEQFLIYLKRSVSVKTNIYSDPQNIIDQLIFDSDNIKHAKFDNVKIETIKKCLELIKAFKTEEFDPENFRHYLSIPSNQDLVDEELEELRIRYELKIYDDNKHFTNVTKLIAKMAYELNEFDTVFYITEKLSKFEWNILRDQDQIISLAELNLQSALSYEDLLLNESIEPGVKELTNFNDNLKVYNENETIMYNGYKEKLFNHIKEACKLAVAINQYWLIFNCAIQLWNTLLQVIKSPNFVALCNENAIPVMSDISEALNSCMVFLESMQADLYDTDFFSKIDIFVNFNSSYAKLLDAIGKSDDCIKVCDNVLSRKLNSNQRKIFDTIRSRASKGEKKGLTKVVPPPVDKMKIAGKSVNPYNPSSEQILISECFSNLETSLITKDDKTRYELLKKSMESLKSYKINFKDESTIEINAELWYKIGVQFYSLGVNNLNVNQYNANNYFKSALVCADNCVKTFTPFDIKNFDIQTEFFADFYAKNNIDTKILSTNHNINSNNNLQNNKNKDNNNNPNPLNVPTDKNKTKTLFQELTNPNNNNTNTTNTNLQRRNNNRDISILLQKWYSVGFLIYADCLNMLVDKEKQERLSQIRLYFTAIEKLIISAKIAENCKQFHVILQATKAFYSIVIQIIDQPQNRERLVRLFLDFHKIYVTNRVGILYSDPEFLLLFYSLFCECINEIKDWSLGEKIITEALKILPQSLHHFILEHKLFYHSKLGKNFLESLNSVDEKDIVTKAKLFAKLARSSANKSDQFKSYNQAIEMLRNDQNILVVDIIFELSTWLYKNNYPFEDIEDNLTQAADILLEIEPIYEEEDDFDDDGQTLHSKRSGSSRRSKISKRSKSKVSDSKRASEKRTNRSSTSNKDSRKVSKTRNYSNKQEKTKTVFAKLLDVDPYPLYMNISHLEKLFKIHIFMGMASDNLKKTKDYLMDSFYFLMKILEISFKTLNCLEFYDKNKDEINKFNQELLQKERNEMPIDTVVTLVNNYFLSRDLNIPQVYTLPENLENWLTFDFPEFFIKKISLFDEKTFFNKKSFEKPYQFYYYLNFLIDKFANDFYFHSQLIPLLKFSILFADFILNNLTLKFTFVLKLKRLYHNILEENFSQDFIKKEIDDKFIPNGIFSQYLMNNERKVKSREELRKYDINLNTDDQFLYDETEENLNSGNLSVVIVEDLKEHICNIELAKELISHGYYNFAKDLLEESIFHCLVLKDKNNYIKANILLAKIYFIESEFEKSFNIYNEMQGINNNVNLFYDIIIEITYILDYIQKYDDLLLFLENCLEFLESLYIKINSPGNKSINIQQLDKCKSLILINLCKIKLKKIESKSTAKELMDYFSKEISGRINEFNNLVNTSGLNMKNLKQILDYCEINTRYLLDSNLFIHMTEEEFNFVKIVLENNLNFLENAQKYLIELQSYIPARIDNSLIYLPLHRLIGFVKVKYCVINNLIGNLNMRIKKEKKKKEKITINNDNKDNRNSHTQIKQSRHKFNDNTTTNAININSNSNIMGNNNILMSNNNIMSNNNVLSNNNNNISNNNININNTNVLSNNNNLSKDALSERIGSEDNRNNQNQNNNIYNKNNQNSTDEENFIDPKTGVRFNNAVVLHLNELTKEMRRIEKQNKGIEHSNYELSISILSSCKSLLPPDSQEYFMFFIEYINSFFNQSNVKSELKKIWDPEILKNISEANKQLIEGNPINENEIFKIKDLHQKTLNLISDFEKSLAEKPKILSSNFGNLRNREILSYYSTIIETSGFLNIELTFKSLMEYQSNFSKIFFIDTIEKYLNLSSRDWVALNSLKTSMSCFDYTISSISYPESINNLNKYGNDLPYFKMLMNPMSWSDIKSILPYNSSYLIFQLTEDRSTLYIGYMYFQNQSEKKTEFYIKRINLDSEINMQIDSMIATIKKMKHTLIKTVMITNDDILKAYEQYDIQIRTITDYFQNLFTDVFEDLNKIINPEKYVEDVQNVEKKNINEKKGKGKGKAAEDGSEAEVVIEPEVTKGKKQVQNTNSNIIESITFLIDYRFYELPFEFFYPFAKIPLKSYDFSLSCLAMRFKANNYNPSTGNTINIDKNSLKFYLDYNLKNFTKIDPKKTIESKINSNNSKNEVKVEGVASYEHYPSIPELQRLYSTSSLFVFMSQTALFYQYSPEEILESSRFSKCKSVIILDRIISTKNFVDQKSLIPKNFSFGSQPLDLIAILTLTGVSTIITTKWSLDLNEASELLDDIIDESIKLMPLSNSIGKYRNPKKVSEPKAFNPNNPLQGQSEEQQVKETKTKGKDNKKKDIKNNTSNSKLDSNLGHFEERIIEKKEILKQAPIVFGLNCSKLN